MFFVKFKSDKKYKIIKKTKKRFEENIEVVALKIPMERCNEFLVKLSK